MWCGVAIVSEQKLFSSTNTRLCLLWLIHYTIFTIYIYLQFNTGMTKLKGENQIITFWKRISKDLMCCFFFNFWPFKSVFLPLGLFRTNSFFSFSLDNNTYWLAWYWFWFIFLDLTVSSVFIMSVSPFSCCFYIIVSVQLTVMLDYNRKMDQISTICTTLNNNKILDFNTAEWLNSIEAKLSGLK